MVAEIRQAPITVKRDLHFVEKQESDEIKPVVIPYREGGHAMLISEAQVYGSIQLKKQDLVDRPSLIHPIYRDLLQRDDIRIQYNGLAKAIDRETGEEKEIIIYSHTGQKAEG